MRLSFLFTTTALACCLSSQGGVFGNGIDPVGIHCCPGTCQDNEGIDFDPDDNPYACRSSTRVDVYERCFTEHGWESATPAGETGCLNTAPSKDFYCCDGCDANGDCIINSLVDFDEFTGRTLFEVDFESNCFDNHGKISAFDKVTEQCIPSQPFECCTDASCNSCDSTKLALSTADCASTYNLAYARDISRDKCFPATNGFVAQNFECCGGANLNQCGFASNCFSGIIVDTMEECLTQHGLYSAFQLSTEECFSLPSDSFYCCEGCDANGKCIVDVTEFDSNSQMTLQETTEAAKCFSDHSKPSAFDQDTQVCVPAVRYQCCSDSNCGTCSSTVYKDDAESCRDAGFAYAHDRVRNQCFGTAAWIPQNFECCDACDSSSGSNAICNSGLVVDVPEQCLTVHGKLGAVDIRSELCYSDFRLAANFLCCDGCDANGKCEIDITDFDPTTAATLPGRDTAAACFDLDTTKISAFNTNTQECVPSVRNQCCEDSACTTCSSTMYEKSVFDCFEKNSNFPFAKDRIDGGCGRSAQSDCCSDSTCQNCAGTYTNTGVSTCFTQGFPYFDAGSGDQCFLTGPDYQCCTDSACGNCQNHYTNNLPECAGTHGLGYAKNRNNPDFPPCQLSASIRCCRGCEDCTDVYGSIPSDCNDVTQPLPIYLDLEDNNKCFLNAGAQCCADANTPLLSTVETSVQDCVTLYGAKFFRTLATGPCTCIQGTDCGPPDTGVGGGGGGDGGNPVEAPPDQPGPSEPGAPDGPAPGAPDGPAPGAPDGPAPGAPDGPAPGAPDGPAPEAPAPAPGGGDTPVTHDGGSLGDPHVLTFCGTWYDYHGVCDLVLLHAQAFHGLRVHIRTRGRWDYSFIETAVLQLGQDTLEVSSWGNYALNGVDQALLVHHEDKKGVSTLDGFPIYHTQPNDKQHRFDIVLGPSENITLSTFKDLVSVMIKGGTAEHFGSSEGLMGNFSGVLLGRDGSTILNSTTNPNAIGEEWQVRDSEPQLFQVSRKPQYPEQCILPSSLVDKSRQGRRRLGETLARSAAETACSHLSGQRLEACVFDVMAVGDVDIAKSVTY